MFKAGRRNIRDGKQESHSANSVNDKIVNFVHTLLEADRRCLCHQQLLLFHPHYPPTSIGDEKS